MQAADVHVRGELKKMDPNYYDQSSSFFLTSPPQHPLADPIQNASVQSAPMQNASIPNPPMPDDISSNHPPLSGQHNPPRHDMFNQ